MKIKALIKLTQASSSRVFHDKNVRYPDPVGFTPAITVSLGTVLPGDEVKDARGASLTEPNLAQLLIRALPVWYAILYGRSVHRGKAGALRLVVAMNGSTSLVPRHY